MNSANPITVLVVDDHPVVREGLGAMVSAESDMTLIGEAETGAAGVQSYFNLRPRVTIMDLLLPDMSGSEAIRQICKRSGDARIIVLTSVAGDEEIYRAIEAGAHGYLFKDMVRRELIQAIRAVCEGRRYIPARVGARIAENLPRSELTSRELEILKLIACGLRTKEIAYKLSVSQATVQAHTKHILAKLGATDRTQAVTRALLRGVIRL